MLSDIVLTYLITVMLKTVLIRNYPKSLYISLKYVTVFFSIILQ